MSNALNYIFPLLLISHVLGDGLLGSRHLAANKRDRRLFRQLSAIAVHSAPHAFFAGALMLLVGAAWLKAAALVYLFHFGIDFIRCKVDMRLFGQGGLDFHQSLNYLLGRRDDAGNPGKKTLRTWAMINIADQTAHLATLWIVASVV